MSAYLETLASYVPAMIVTRANANPAGFEEPTAERCQGIVLFADISGFTALTGRLAQRGPAGAEDLTRILNTYFGQLIDLIAEHGGDILKFAGDALIALWPHTEGEMPALAHRVAQCCLIIQKKLHAYPVADDVRLSLKLGIGAGDMVIETVGGVFNRWEVLPAGPPLVQVGIANNHATPGDIVVSPETQALLGDNAIGEMLPDNTLRLTGLKRPIEPKGLGMPIVVPEAGPTLRYFIPGAIRTKLDAGQVDWLGELRLVSVIFANFPNFSIDTPLERVHNVVKTLQTALYRFEGSLNKISVDDKGASILGTMGMPPLTHEDDPERAVRAAMALRDAFNEMAVVSSIGVTTGQTFCGAIGNRTRREYTVMGDPVNMAARLMVAAKGGTLCDKATTDAARGRLNFSEAIPIKVKGKDQAINVYHPLQTTVAAPTVKTRKIRLFGRIAERAQLRKTVDALTARQESATVLVTGEAGIGKSRLLQEMIAEGRERGVLVLAGAGESIESNTPYHVWRALLGQLFEIDRLPHDAAARRNHVLEQLPDDPLILPFAPLLNAILPLEMAESDATTALTGRARADKTNDLIARLLERAAATKPLVVVVTGAHFMDLASWAMVALVAKRVRPAVLVLGTRPITDSPPPEFKALIESPATVRVQLGPLSGEETTELVCHRLGVDHLPDRVGPLILEKAEGNPLFCEELAYALRDSGFLEIEGRDCRIKSGAGDPSGWKLPQSVNGAITGRIDRLPPAEQMTIKVASVVGRVVPRQVVYEIYPIETAAAEIDRHFESLHALDLTPLVRGGSMLDSDDDGVAHKFKNNVTQDIAYNLMLYSQRRTLHRAAAEWYERRFADNLAQHYSFLAHQWRSAIDDREPDPALSWKAIDYLEKAGQQAVGSFAMREAVRFFHQAIELLEKLPDDDTRAPRELRLQLALGGPLMATRSYGAPEVEKAYGRAAELCKRVADESQAFPALRGLWQYQIGRAEYGKAKKLAAQLLDMAKFGGNKAHLMEAHRTVGNTSYWIGEFPECVDSMGWAMDLYDPVAQRGDMMRYGQDPGVTALGLSGWATAFLGYPNLALRKGQESIDLARTLGHPYSLGYALAAKTVTHFYLRQVEEGRQCATETLTLCKEKGFPFFITGGQLVRGWAEAMSGRIDAGLAEMEDGLRLWRSTGSKLGMPFFLSSYAITQGMAGRYEQALETLRDPIFTDKSREEGWFHAPYHRLQGLFGFKTGAPAEAVDENFRLCIEIARAQNAKLLELYGWLSLADVREAQGRAAEVLPHLAECYDWFIDGLDTPVMQFARDRLAALEKVIAAA